MSKKSVIVPAEPGYATLTMDIDDSRVAHLDERVPVIAWHVSRDEVTPVHAVGRDDEYGGMLCPDGRVWCCLDEVFYDDIEAWLGAWGTRPEPEPIPVI